MATITQEEYQRQLQNFIVQESANRPGLFPGISGRRWDGFAEQKEKELKFYTFDMIDAGGNASNEEFYNAHNNE